MDYLEVLSKLNKKQKKDILNIIAQDRIDEYGAAGKAANLGDRAFSILGGSGNNIRLNPTEEERFISLAMETLKPKRKGRAKGGNILEDDRAKYKDGGKGIKALRKVAPEVVERMGYVEGGSMDDQMLMVMTPTQEPNMESDDDMEDGYTRFIMDEALSEEEEDMLMSKLEQDEELAMLFDKVIDVAQEFAGSGPVEGPGSGVSDSIPARLSDGEFVFTAKATEQIGADELMRMMKDAEAAADERQTAYNGGLMGDQLEKVVTTETRITKPADVMSPALGAEEDNMIQEEVTRNMLDPRVPHVRS
jgi:hypothetical protein